MLSLENCLIKQKMTDFQKLSSETDRKMFTMIAKVSLDLFMFTQVDINNVVFSKYPIPKKYTGLEEDIILYEFFNQKTGHMVSITDYELLKDANFNLFYNPYGPLLADISITDYCTLGCSYCYVDAKNTNKGFISLEYLRTLLSTIGSTSYQWALGGGNPNQHPLFTDILRTIREDFNIIPSYTTNGLGMTEEVIEATKKYCGAVAVSKHHDINLFLTSIDKLIKAGIKTNVHWVVSKQSYPEIKAMFESSINLGLPLIDERLNGVIFLLNKPTGRSSEENNLTPEQCEEFGSLVNQYLKNKSVPDIGFDSCFSPIMNLYTDVKKEYFDTCDGSRFSIFGDYDKQFYPCSFDQKEKSFWVTPEINNWDDFIEKVWNSEQFTRFRNILNSSCPDCSTRRNCMGGCPILNNIVPCNEKVRI